MDDKYLLEHGYKEYPPVAIDCENIVARFQKRFDDDFGKKYFIDVIKWSNDYIPTRYRTEYYEPYSYEYEVQISMLDERKPINFHFFTHWSLEEVENFMENFFEKMRPNYYESWDESWEK